jgi:hypothetical protein
MMRSVAAGLLFVSGCSLLTVSGPKAPPAAPACTSSNAAPVFDTVMAVAFAVAAGGTGFAASQNEEGSSGIDRGIDTGVFAISLPLAVLFAVSAGLGFSRVSKCRAATAAP